MEMEMNMKSIADWRMFYNWRMARRGGGFLVGSLVAAGAAGAFAAAARHAPRMAALGITPTIGLAAFVALALLSGFLWWRFSSVQDEMFHRIQNYSYGWGAALSIVALVIWGIANAATLAPPIDPLAPLILLALFKSFFWTRAVRTWL
jgi:hypothetical protein